MIAMKIMIVEDEENIRDGIRNLVDWNQEGFEEPLLFSSAVEALVFLETETVDVVLTPSDSLAWKNRKKRERLQAELENRQVSANTGGMNRRKIVTAYREKALYLCCILENREVVTYGELREMGLEEKYMSILRSNVYHWFERVEKGVYRLSEEGRKALEEPDYEKVIEYYRKK